MTISKAINDAAYEVSMRMNRICGDVIHYRARRDRGSLPTDRAQIDECVLRNMVSEMGKVRDIICNATQDAEMQRAISIMTSLEVKYFDTTNA